jgi:hypothetical protein
MGGGGVFGVRRKKGFNTENAETPRTLRRGREESPRRRHKAAPTRGVKRVGAEKRGRRKPGKAGLKPPLHVAGRSLCR